MGDVTSREAALAFAGVAAREANPKRTRLAPVAGPVLSPPQPGSRPATRIQEVSLENVRVIDGSE
jgi:hypothetical protein